MPLEVESLIERIIERAPEPVLVPSDMVDDVLKFFALYKLHKGVVRAGESIPGPQLIGIVLPRPELLACLHKNR